MRRFLFLALFISIALAYSQSKYFNNYWVVYNELYATRNNISIEYTLTIFFPAWAGLGKWIMS